MSESKELGAEIASTTVHPMDTKENKLDRLPRIISGLVERGLAMSNPKDGTIMYVPLNFELNKGEFKKGYMNWKQPIEAKDEDN